MTFEGIWPRKQAMQPAHLQTEINQNVRNTMLKDQSSSKGKLHLLVKFSIMANIIHEDLRAIIFLLLFSFFPSKSGLSAVGNCHGQERGGGFLYAVTEVCIINASNRPYTS